MNTMHTFSWRFTPRYTRGVVAGLPPKSVFRHPLNDYRLYRRVEVEELLARIIGVSKS
jgi:hypothetical protein